ncbi:methylglyoxal synthase, partial [Pantanalinema sp. GBBB05]|uniref:methylglyoxal synthase n=1 Tax=Pantanalinema sp. GBBB05 TaxID=2604139 RepID=UPI001D30053D|nr:methylglyoxal synthase [Pantanalinema sp. GBBB05]
MAATIAFIAHDARKDDLVNFVTQRAGLWSRYQIIATKGTAERLQTATQLTLTAVAAGAIGGDVQIAAQVVEGNVIAVIFLIDPLYSQPHEPSLLTLQQVCNLYNVPLATNLATAEAIAAQLAKSLVAHLIYNPVSGQGNAEQELALIQQLLEPNLHLHI